MIFLTLQHPRLTNRQTSKSFTKKIAIHISIKNNFVNKEPLMADAENGVRRSICVWEEVRVVGGYVRREKLFFERKWGGGVV